MNHSLERTSPKGELFLGKCVYCGATDLLIGAALQPCPKGKPIEQTILEAIKERKHEDSCIRS